MLDLLTLITKNRPPWQVAGIDPGQNRVVNPNQNGATPGGAVPSSWEVGVGTACAYTRIGYGYENGIRYVDWRISGTSQAGSDNAAIYFTPSAAQFAAAQNDVFDHIVFIKLAGGSMTNVVGVANSSDHLDGAHGYLGGNYSGLNMASILHINKPLNKCMNRERYTVTTASTGFISSYLSMIHGLSVPIDYTLRIGHPMVVKV